MEGRKSKRRQREIGMRGWRKGGKEENKGGREKRAVDVRKGMKEENMASKQRIHFGLSLLSVPEIVWPG